MTHLFVLILCTNVSVYLFYFKKKGNEQFVNALCRKNEPQTPKTKEQEILDQVEQVKGIMHNNIDKMVQNIDNLEVLQDKTGIITALNLCAVPRSKD